MEFEINTNQVILKEQDQVESGEYNVTECSFTFSSEYEGLTKKAVFTGEDGTAYLQTIVNEKCSIPSEILEVSQVVEIGVYAYDVENEELVLRYSPEPTQFYIHQGSYKEAQNSTPPTPSEIEQLQAQITTNANDIDTLEGNVADVKQDIVDIKAEQLVQNQDISNLQTTKADKSEIPTKVSQLTNDSGYIDNTVDDLVNYTKSSDLSAVATTGSYNDLLNKPFIPTKTSEIINDSGYITKNVSDLANYYKKTETYNKTEIDSKISSVYKYKGTVATYDDLPSTSLTVGDVYNVESDGSNYAWTGTTWDKLGGEIDLSDYYTKTQTDSLLSAKANSSDVYTKTETYNKTEVNTLLNDKVDKVQGKGLSTEDFTTAEQTKLAGIEAEANKTIVDSSLDDTSTNPVQNKVIYESQEQQDNQIEALQQENAELQNDIQNMSKAMLTTKGQGTDFTLNNTTDNKFVKFEGSGNTYQEQLTGANLMKFSTRTATPSGLNYICDNKGQVTLTGTATADPVIAYNQQNEAITLNSGTYTIKVIGTGFTNLSLRKSGTNINIPLNENLEGTITISEDDTSYRIVIVGTNGTTYNANFRITLASGNTATEEYYCGGIPAPNPSYEIPVKNVTGNANVKIQNKNLWNNELEIAEYDTTGTKVSTQVWLVNTTKIKVKPNTQYTISQKEHPSQYRIVYWEDDTYITKDQNTQDTTNGYSSYTFTTPINCNYISIHFRTTIERIAKGSYVVQTTDITDAQLEQGSTATSYVPHQEQNLSLTLGMQRMYKRSYLADDGSHNLRKQIVFDGTENWSMFNLSETKKQFYINDASLKVKHNTTEPTVISNYFISAVVSDRSIKTNITFSTTNGLGFVTEDILTLEDWKAWVTQKYTNNHPLIAEYDLTEEEIISYNETQQAQYNAMKKAMSYNEQTNISSTSNELGMIIDAEAIQNANNVISTINSRLDLIEG